MSHTLVDILADVTAALPSDHPVIVGPPFRLPPAPPCYVVEPPNVSDVYGTSAQCTISGATVDVVCVPRTATDADQLVSMADAVIVALGASVVSGSIEPNPYTDVDAVYVYRLTCQE
jgi:hypothetical protein